MYKTILWAQNEHPGIPPTILINGKDITGEDAQKAFDELSAANQILELSPEIREKFQNKCEKKGIFFSRQANYKILPEKEGVYVQGSYLEEDNVGRKMGYMFLCKGTDQLDNTFRKLREESHILNRTCNEEELKRLSAYNSKLKKKIILSLIVTILLVFIIWIILSQIN